MEISKRIDEGIDSSFDLLDCHELIVNHKNEHKQPQYFIDSIDQTTDRTIKLLKRNDKQKNAAHKIIYCRLLLNNKIEYDQK